MLENLEQRIISCEKCPRLRDWCADVAEKKKKMYEDFDYWGKPVPGFGDPNATLVILGLAPGAHGANRTGRVFSGDDSGEWLYEAMNRYGFANKPRSEHRGDGLELIDAYISNVVRCAPPGNKPLKEEVDACQPYLIEEFQLLTKRKVVLILGKIAFDNYLKLLKREGRSMKGLAFSHGASFTFENGQTMIVSYHPSRQNTNTRKLTRKMWYEIFEKVREAVDAAKLQQ